MSVLIIWKRDHPTAVGEKVLKQPQTPGGTHTHKGTCVQTYFEQVFFMNLLSLFDHCKNVKITQRKITAAAVLSEEYNLQSYVQPYKRFRTRSEDKSEDNISRMLNLVVKSSSADTACAAFSKLFSCVCGPSTGIPRTPHPSELSPYYPLSPGAVGSIAHPLGWLMPQ